ncbi:MAG: hypothetical protein LQ341_000960 [Variospora aurantia]|nr:MAG: hypothetical protein LQ341_000960 [Variospora aurantia]
MNLISSRKGVADEQLAKVEQDRKRMSAADDSPYRSGKRSISASTSSSASVSTISTNMSRSPSPKQDEGHDTLPSQKQFQRNTSRDMNKSRGRSLSYSSDSSYEKARARAPMVRKQESGARPSADSHKAIAGERVQEDLMRERCGLGHRGAIVELAAAATVWTKVGLREKEGQTMASKPRVPGYRGMDWWMEGVTFDVLTRMIGMKVASGTRIMGLADAHKRLALTQAMNRGK